MNEKNLDEKYIRKNFDREVIEILKTKRLNELFGIEEFDEGLEVKKVKFLMIVFLFHFILFSFDL